MTSPLSSPTLTLSSTTSPVQRTQCASFTAAVSWPNTEGRYDVTLSSIVRMCVCGVAKQK